MIFGSLTFMAPYLLLGLVILPILWWLLRATPPAPKHLRFPGVQLLLGLRDKDRMPQKTPLWLLLLRMSLLALLIMGFAKPVLNPEEKTSGNGPLLVLMDGGWASAADWDDRLDTVELILSEAARNGRPTVFHSLAMDVPKGEAMAFQDAQGFISSVRALEPKSWPPNRTEFAEWVDSIDEDFETYWITDDLEHEETNLVSVLMDKGPLSVFATRTQQLAIKPVKVVNENIVATIITTPSDLQRMVSVALLGQSPSGVETRFLVNKTVIGPGESVAQVVFELPLELRNRVTRAIIENQSSAAAVALAGDGLRRRKVGLVKLDVEEGPRLISPVHFIRTALEDNVALIEGDITTLLATAPDVLILSDVGAMSVSSTEALEKWVNEGGTLLRFAGPRMAASGVGQLVDDPLLPVRLRTGGRELGGAMSWTTPKEIAPFKENSPFFGLKVPDDVKIFSQVVAQPEPSLSKRTLAALEDGTPLVTSRSEGMGRVILFHISANAEWSNLPLSSLFVNMLDRLSIRTSANISTLALEGRSWAPTKVLNGFGQLVEPELLKPVLGEALKDDTVSITMPAGIYRADDQSFALNVMNDESELSRFDWPASISVTLIGERKEISLQKWFLMGALILLVLDILATLFVTGRLQGRGAQIAMVMFLFILGASLPFDNAMADEELALLAANETVLAYVTTDDASTDAKSAAGLLGLSNILFSRTSIEPAEPIGIDIEQDDISLFPMLYWPITSKQKTLSEDAVLKVNRYMSNGGVIVFDTQDAQFGGGYNANTTDNGRALQRLTRQLEIPPLSPVPQDHVLTRAFYLLSEFPGRWEGPNVWVEASATNMSQRLGAGLITATDGVTPVVIGANDWAAAWAVSNNDQTMFPVGKGLAGNRQREMAYRFGVNLVMYVMTGNYKSDQVHVPALLERLGE